MNILYIGQYPLGSTSHMRGEVLRSHFRNSNFYIIDISLPFDSACHLLRSIAFRYKKGPLILKINNYILTELKQIDHSQFDLIWVDKAVFVTEKTTQLLRQKCQKLVHFTPDPAFLFHKSSHFNKSLQYYDYAITTKSYELKQYWSILPQEKTLLVTQGFQKDLHIPIVPFEDKTPGVLFIGHYEKERGLIVKMLINAHIHVAIAGIKWKQFIEQNRHNTYLEYLGSGVFGKEYVKLLAKYQFSWGAVSKWIPELHTTRTFEIPACGTALICERNDETQRFFTDEEAILYSSPKEMIDQINFYMNHLQRLKILTQNGRDRVVKDGRDYSSIIIDLIRKINL